MGKNADWGKRNGLVGLRVPITRRGSKKLFWEFLAFLVNKAPLRIKKKKKKDKSDCQGGRCFERCRLFCYGFRKKMDWTVWNVRSPSPHQTGRIVISYTLLPQTAKQPIWIYALGAGRWDWGTPSSKHSFLESTKTKVFQKIQPIWLRISKQNGLDRVKRPLTESASNRSHLYFLNTPSPNW